MVVVSGLEFLGCVAGFKDAVDRAVDADHGHGHALFVLGGQQAASLVEFEVLPVLVDDARVFGDELAGVVFLVVLDVAVDTVDLGLLGEHARPGGAQDALLADLVLLGLAAGHEPLAALPSVAEWFGPLAEVWQWFVVVELHLTFVVGINWRRVDVCLLE